MSEIYSNLCNVLPCGARSKRTGQPCRQPKMKDKQRCRIHGGKSTGPRTIEGRRRISQARTIHGDYSKATKQQREINKTLSLIKDIGKAELKQAQALSPLLNKAMDRINLQDRFGVLEYDFYEFIVFGHFSSVLKKSKNLAKSTLEEYFLPLLGSDWYPQLLEVLDFIDEKIRLRTGVSKQNWKGLTASQKAEEYEAMILTQCYDEMHQKMV